MAPSPTPQNLAPRADAREIERDSTELLEGLLDLTLNVLTELDDVDGRDLRPRDLRPAVSVRRRLSSLRHFPPPQKGSMSDRLRAVVVAKRRESLAGIAQQATVIGRRVGRDCPSPAAAALYDLWRQVGALAESSTAALDLRPLAAGLDAAVGGPLREYMGYALKFEDDIRTLTAGDEGARRRVLKRWAAQIERTWRPREPRIRRILQETKDPAKLKREALYAGLWEAITDSDRLQRVRLGREWVKDHARLVSHPRPMRVEPRRFLTRWWGPELYWLWLRRRAIAGGEEYMLGVPDEFVETVERDVNQYKDGLRTRTATPGTLPLALDADRLSREDLESVNATLSPLDALVRAEEAAEAARQLVRVPDAARRAGERRVTGQALSDADRQALARARRQNRKRHRPPE